jgi:3-oxoacyl-[acyl-carrier-protein] synthase II
MRQHEIVISGIGVVSPFGVGAAPFWRALCEGRSAIAEIRRFDPGPAPPRLGAEVPDFPAREFLPPPLVRRMDRVSQMIGVASVLAAADAGLAQTHGEHFGVVVGAALGNLSESAQFLERLFTKGPSLANPMLFPNLVLNAPASQVAMALGWRGPNLTIAAGEIAGEAALDAALGLVRRGRASAVVAAAGEELSAVLLQAMGDVGAVSPRRGGRERSAPFDRDANGPVLGEGAAAIVVESAESVRRRRAKSYATVTRLDRFTLPAATPHRWPAGASDVSPPLVRSSADLVFSGADSSPERDSLELVLGAALAPPGRPVYSLAGAVGSHGGQGLSTIVAAVLALSSGRLPPIAGLEHPRADRWFRFPRSLLEGEWSRAVVLGVARGGDGAAIELARGDVSTR